MEHKSRKSWQECNKCGIKTRSLRLDNDGFVCFNCYRKTIKHTRIPVPAGMHGRRGYTFEEALEKEYTVVDTGRGWHCSFPQALAGYKFKIKLIKKDEEYINVLQSVESANADKETGATK